MWFRNLPLRYKFGVLTGVIAGAFAVALLIGERQFSGLSHIVQELDTNRIPSIQHLSAMRAALADYRTYEFRHTLATNDQQMAALEAMLAAERARFISAEFAYMAIISDSVEDKIYKDFKIFEKQYLATHERLMSLSRENNNAEAQIVLNGEATTLYDTCRHRIQELIDRNVQLAKKLDGQADSQRRIIVSVVVGFSLLLLVTTVLVYFVIQRMVIIPIQRLETAIQRSEHMDSPIDIDYEAKDEIGSLVTSYKQMMEHISDKNEEVQVQNAEILRQQRIMEVQAQYLERANSSLRQNNVDLRQFMQREFLRMEELTRHKDALIKISREEVLHSGDIKSAFQHINEQGALHLDVSRMSIWLWRGGRSYLGSPQTHELELIDLYDRVAHEHSDSVWLSEEDYPHYFSALETLDIIDATDAETDKRTQEFTEKYLKPLGISAMLDVPIRSGNIVIGVLCAEYVGGKREWTLEEEIFARSLGTFIVTALDAREKARQRERLADLNRELLLVNTDMQDKNIALQNAQEAAAQTLLYINHQNQLLEVKTQELISANKELLEKQGLMLEVNNLLSEAHKQLNQQNTLLQERNEQATLSALSLKDENSALRMAHEELQSAYSEIKRQHELLEYQSRHASAMTSELQGKNELLLQANTELSGVYRELRRQNELLQEQSVTIQEANTELQEKNIQLIRIDQEKNDMLGIVAHDLRNPLSSIMLGSAFLRRLHERGQLTDDDMLRHLSRIEVTAERMNTIISELLDLNAIETGKMKLNVVDLDIGGLLKLVAEDFQKRAEEKNITIKTNLLPSVERISTDARIMRQVLDNLVSNAIKFSPSGRSITLEMKHEKTKVSILIHDEGPGISKEDQANLFQKFTRLSARPTAGEHSTGLGLSIVKKFTAVLGGTVRCESAPEKGRIGSTFIVELPLQTLSAQSTSETHSHTS